MQLEKLIQPILTLLIKTLVFITIWVSTSVGGYSQLSRDLCVRDRFLLRPEIKKQIREVSSLFTDAGLPMRLSCSSPTSIIISSTEDMSSAQAIGQTRMNGLIRNVDGQDLFMPLLLPTWPIQEIKIRKDFVDTYYFKLIVIHEIGHTLGIGHSHDVSNVMYPEIEPQIDPAEAVQHVKELSYVHFK